MARGDGSLIDFLFQQPGREPRYGDRWGGTFWERHFWPVSLFGASVIVLALALVVALVTTIVYASVDAGRSLGGEAAVEGPTATFDEPVGRPAATSTTEPEPGGLTRIEAGRQVGLQVYSVTTLEAAGTASFGSAFVAGSGGGQALMLTTYTAVRGATAGEAEITVQREGRASNAILWTWDERADLALLVVDGAESSGLPLALGGEPGPGDTLFAVTPGGGSAEGEVVRFDPTVLVHDIDLDDRSQGSPLVDDEGQVVAVASATYAADGTDAGEAAAVPIALACDRVLSCSEGSPDAGARS